MSIEVILCNISVIHQFTSGIVQTVKIAKLLQNCQHGWIHSHQLPWKEKARGKVSREQ